jgi:Xaa-Pro aminopeptidase
VPSRWRNIGVRIEDDVAVGSNGPDVLTLGLVKEPDAIEKLMTD